MKRTNVRKILIPLPVDLQFSEFNLIVLINGLLLLLIRYSLTAITYGGSVDEVKCVGESEYAQVHDHHLSGGGSQREEHLWSVDGDVELQTRTTLVLLLYLHVCVHIMYIVCSTVKCSMQPTDTTPSLPYTCVPQMLCV